MDKKEKILWINGLKGLACLAVFFHHFLNSYYPATLYGNDASYIKTASGFEASFSNRPWGFIINGNFAVTIFVLLAAFLASIKIFKLNEQDAHIDFFKICFDRYLRLMRPVAFWGIFYFVLMKICLAFGFNESNFIPPCNFKQLILHILLYQWFTEDTFVIGPLWTMKALLLGVFIAMFVSLFSSKKRWFMPFIYLVIALGLTECYAYYAVAVLGTFAADIYYYDRVSQLIEWADSHKLKLSFLKNRIFKNIVGTVFIITGLYVGGFPTINTPIDKPYSAVAFVAVRLFPKCPIPMIHGNAALALTLGIMMLSKTRILSSKPCNFLGKICFNIYLIHPIVLTSVSYWFVNVFSSLFKNYHLGVLTSFVLCSAIIIGMSTVAELISKKTGTLIKKPASLVKH